MSTSITLGPTSTTAMNTKTACKHLHTKRPFNDRTLVCEDCKKDITDTQDGLVAKAAPAASVPASTPVVKDAV